MSKFLEYCQKVFGNYSYASDDSNYGIFVSYHDGNQIRVMYAVSNETIFAINHYDYGVSEMTFPDFYAFDNWLDVQLKRMQ